MVWSLYKSSHQAVAQYILWGNRPPRRDPNSFATVRLCNPASLVWLDSPTSWTLLLITPTPPSGRILSCHVGVHQYKLSGGSAGWLAGTWSCRPLSPFPPFSNACAATQDQKRGVAPRSILHSGNRRVLSAGDYLFHFYWPYTRPFWWGARLALRSTYRLVWRKNRRQ